MKKIVIATILTTAAMLAQAQAGISGKVGYWMDRTELGGKSTNAGGLEPTSNIAFTASEKLGALRATAVVETSLSGNTFGGSETRLGDRTSTVGLSGSNWGLSVGRDVHGHFLTVSDADAFSTLVGSIAGDVHNLRDLRMSNAVSLSLAPFKGTALRFDHSPTSGNEVSSFSGSATVAGFTGSASRWENRGQRSTAFALGTSVAGFKVSYLRTDDMMATAAASSVGQSVGVSRNMGPYTFKGSVGRTDKDVKAYALGVDYALSKRTALGLAYRDVDRTGTAGDVQQVAFGMVHKF